MSDYTGTVSACRVWINGEARELAHGVSVGALLGELGRHPRTVAIERNGVIVPRTGLDNAILVDGDRVEIIAFTQGG